MPSSKLIRWCGLSTMLAAVMLVVADLLNFTIDFDPYSEAVTTVAFATQSWLNLLAALLLLLGLVGLYARQAESAGALGLAGFLLAFAGTALWMGTFWTVAFAAPTLAVANPGFLDTEAGLDTGLLGTGSLLSISIAGLGWLVFGAATLRARVYPRIAGVLLIIGVVATFLPGTIIVFGLAIAWLGFALMMGRGTTATEQPSRVS